MANKIQRAWYVDKLKRIGIVEKASNAVTKDGYTSNWQSISEIKDLRMYAISRDTDVAVDTLTGTFIGIPEQFHETIAFKVIARGYRDPRNMNLQVAQFFDGEYLTGLKQAKKFSKSNYQTTGRIKPQDF